MPRPQKRVTLKDVAQLANVSLKTASNVKNDWPYISQETRQRVLDAMATLNYRPSRLAASLVTGRSHTIGVVVPDISNPFFGYAFRGCEDTLAAHKYSSFLCNTDEDLEKEEYYLNLLVAQGVDGLILWGLRSGAEAIERLLPEHLQVIIVDAEAGISRQTMTAIQVQNRQGAQQITAHLLGSGRRKIAYLSGWPHRKPAMERRSGYLQALEEAGSGADSIIFEGKPSIRGGYLATLELLKTNTTPDALFCYNDLMAIGAMQAIEENGLNIPQDIAVAGFDDILPASLVMPALTTVRIEHYALGRLAAHHLMQRMVQPQPGYQEVQYPVQIRVRQSTVHTPLSKEAQAALRAEIIQADHVYFGEHSE